MVLALDGGEVIGASAGLLPAYRGQGLGVRFFIERESYAHKLAEFDYCALCAVERLAGHPQRPVDYKPLQGFWRNRGFLDEPSLRTTYQWRDLGEPAQSSKIVSFWQGVAGMGLLAHGARVGPTFIAGYRVSAWQCGISSYRQGRPCLSAFAKVMTCTTVGCCP